MKVKVSRELAMKEGTGLVRVNRTALSNMGASPPDAAAQNKSLRQRIPLLFIKLALCGAI
jgi:hypothetical protein